MISWAEYEERYGESREDFIDEEDRLQSWEQAQADAAGVPLFGPL